ncbi:MAG: peptide deformylase [Actinobacteria bacterium]|nr:peptide deformylase [Actinomycetota bacterium]
MAVEKIRTFGDPVLREKCFEVSKIDDSVKTLVRNLTDTMKDAPGVGLAASQIGVLRRVFVYDIGEGTQVLINPALLRKKGEIVEEEGCLSLYEIKCPVKRYQKVVIKGKNLNGEEVIVEAEDLLARVMQHEMDHLEGILFIDKVSEENRRKVLEVITTIQLKA